MNRTLEFLQKYGVVVAFVILLIVNAIWQGDVFFRPENLRNIVNQNAAVGILAVGMTIVIVAGGIDLSVGSMLALSACLGVEALNRAIGGGREESAAVWVAALSCVGAGLGLGMINGLLVAFGRVVPFIATLGGLVAYRSLALVVGNGGEIRSQSSSAFSRMGTDGVRLPFVTETTGQGLLIPWPVITFLVVALVFGFLLNRTRFGMYAVAVGSNEKAARYSGINTRKIVFASFALMGLLAGVAGLLQASRMNSVASGQLGQMNELDAIAAVVIGGGSLAGGRGRIWGTVIGVLLLGTINNMLIVGSAPVYWQGFVKGAIIILAVLLQGSRRDQ